MSAVIVPARKPSKGVRKPRKGSSSLKRWGIVPSCIKATFVVAAAGSGIVTATLAFTGAASLSDRRIPLAPLSAWAPRYDPNGGPGDFFPKPQWANTESQGRTEWSNARRKVEELHQQLQAITDTATRRTSRIDMLTKTHGATMPSVPMPPKAPIMEMRLNPPTSSWHPHAWLMMEKSGDGLEASPNVQPPILTFASVAQDVDWWAGADLARDLVLPTRMYPAQHSIGIADSDDASVGENAEERMAFEAAVEKLEMMWFSAEAAVASLSAAGRLASRRVPKSVGQFRDRVMDVVRESWEGKMCLSNDRCEKIAGVFGKEERLLSPLRELELQTLEYEGITAALAKDDEAVFKFLRSGSTNRDIALMRRYDSLQVQLTTCTNTVRQLCTAAQKMMDNDAGSRALSDALGGFRIR